MKVLKMFDSKVLNGQSISSEDVRFVSKECRFLGLAKGDLKERLNVK